MKNMIKRMSLTEAAIPSAFTSATNTPSLRNTDFYDV